MSNKDILYALWMQAKKPCTSVKIGEIRAVALQNKEAFKYRSKTGITPSGINYAVLKFILEYTTPVNWPDGLWTQFNEAKSSDSGKYGISQDYPTLLVNILSSKPIEHVQNSKIRDTQSNPISLPSNSRLIQPPQVIRAYEFYAGYIRVKISVKNPTPFTIHDVILEPDVDRAILYLERHEPEEYLSENERIILGNINPHNDRTVSLYLEPIICAREGTDVNCHIRYKNAKGKPGSLDMEPLRIQVVCPIFETKEPVNIGSLKQLIESLPSRDTKIFSVPRTLDAPTQLKIFQGVIQTHDIRHISTLRRAKNFESWYYGKTKVTQKDMVIKLGIVKDMDMVEITAFSYDPKDLTGLLAEINRHITKEVSKRENVQKIFNITIKDSVVQRSNLMNFCNADGKCSGDVTIEDSVVMRSNIG
ncbi:MAG: hypothetical protein NTZ39_07450 [Methanoregula sp.]|nr:hypothetical protein [Methanoregula sp.]